RFGLARLSARHRRIRGELESDLGPGRRRAVLVSLDADVAPPLPRRGLPRGRLRPRVERGQHPDAVPRAARRRGGRGSSSSGRGSGPTTATGWVLRALFVLVAFPIALWGTLALHFAGPRGGATILPVVWAVGVFAILLFVRPFGRRAVAFTLAAAALFAWWSTIRPSNDRQWQPDVARPPYVELHGD